MHRVSSEWRERRKAWALLRHDILLPKRYYLEISRYRLPYFDMLLACLLYGVLKVPVMKICQTQPKGCLYFLQLSDASCGQPKSAICESCRQSHRVSIEHVDNPWKRGWKTSKLEGFWRSRTWSGFDSSKNEWPGLKSLDSVFGATAPWLSRLAPSPSIEKR
jgi:hypothetical protein